MEELNTIKQPLLYNCQESFEVELPSRNSPKEEEKTPEIAPPRPSSPPHQSASNKTGTIQCAGCKVMLSYDKASYCVKCPKCSTLTAVIQVSKGVCKLCRRELIFPANALYVSCPCGNVLGNQYIDRRYLS